MRLIYKYIIRQLFLGILITTLSLTTIIWLTQSLNLIEFIVNNGLPVKIFFKLTMLLLPTFLVLIIPIASFVVTLFIYNKLISDREIAVMRASGLSSFSIAKPAVYLSLFSFCLICF
jgi:lipopolysaccharide export system permease protein